MHLFILLLLFLGAQAVEDCQTPTNQPGKCVLINHCPHLFSTIIRNDTDKSKNAVKKAYCGLEAGIFPKVCCPTEGIKYFEEAGAISQNQYSTKCGLHEPDSPSDPWLGLLEYQRENGERSFLCVGVLINKRYVLTAAHCIKSYKIPHNYKLINVYFGKFSDTYKPPIIAPVDGTTIHEGYDPHDPHHYNDIALVRLKNKISFKDGFVKPICIPMDNKKNLVGKTLSVTGYQKTEHVAKKRDGVATVWNNSECNLVYEVSEVRLGDSQMCAGGRRLYYRHSHKFDLGGVLMQVSKDNSYNAVGILALEASTGDKENYPKVYTKIASYMDWIFGNLKP